MIKILHQKWKCIGCGSCVAVDMDRWEMDDNNLAHLKGSKHSETAQGTVEELEVEDIKDSQEAVDICPVECIHIKNS